MSSGVSRQGDNIPPFPSWNNGNIPAGIYCTVQPGSKGHVQPLFGCEDDQRNDFCIPCKQIQRDYSPELYISSFVLMKEMILPICASETSGIMVREYALRHHVLRDLDHVKSRTSYSISLHVFQVSATGHR